MNQSGLVWFDSVLKKRKPKSNLHVSTDFKKKIKPVHWVFFFSPNLHYNILYVFYFVLNKCNAENLQNFQTEHLHYNLLYVFDSNEWRKLVNKCNAEQPGNLLQVLVQSKSWLYSSN